jgi:hypothetical protein
VTRYLLDTNLLIALAWPQHIHHAQAHAWFGKTGHQAWATCPITQLGFVRISSNAKIIPAAVASLALVGYRQITDAYVVALAQYHKGALATFDRGIGELISAGKDRMRYVTVVDVR